MNITKPKEVVINAWKTFKTRDARLIAELFASDAEWIAPAGNATAVALKHTDHMIRPDQIANFIASEMHHLFSNVTSRFAAYMPMAILWCSRSRCEPLFRAASPMRMTIASSLSWPATASSRCANTWTHGLADDFRGRLRQLRVQSRLPRSLPSGLRALLPLLKLRSPSVLLRDFDQRISRALIACQRSLLSCRRFKFPELAHRGGC